MPLHALPYLAAARVRGPDATAFLHAQLSADVAAFADGEAGFACYCSPRGQVYGLLLVCRRADEFLLAGSAELLPDILDRLRLFVLRARLDLAGADDCAVLGVEPPAEGPAVAYETGSGLCYAVAPRAAEPEHAEPEQDAAAWKLRELQHGVAWLGKETSERFIPQMLGFDRIGAVSFSKGCYPGQEIVARAKYLGKVKRGPLRLLLETPDDSAAELADRVEAGAGLTLHAGSQRLEATLIDCAVSGSTGQVLLFVVAPAADDAIDAVEVAGRGYRCATI